MTVQEAIKAIQVEGLEIQGKLSRMNEFLEGLEMAEEALEKQIPKKILYREQSCGTPWLCPECESDQIKVEFFREDGYEPKDKHSYCWKCGQKLDWGELK